MERGEQVRLSTACQRAFLFIHHGKTLRGPSVHRPGRAAAAAASITNTSSSGCSGLSVATVCCSSPASRSLCLVPVVFLLLLSSRSAGRLFSAPCQI